MPIFFLDAKIYWTIVNSNLVLVIWRQTPCLSSYEPLDFRSNDSYFNDFFNLKINLKLNSRLLNFKSNSLNEKSMVLIFKKTSTRSILSSDHRGAFLYGDQCTWCSLRECRFWVWVENFTESSNFSLSDFNTMENHHSRKLYTCHARFFKNATKKISGLDPPTLYSIVLPFVVIYFSMLLMITQWLAYTLKVQFNGIKKNVHKFSEAELND